MRKVVAISGILLTLLVAAGCGRGSDPMEMAAEAPAHRLMNAQAAPAEKSAMADMAVKTSAGVGNVALAAAGAPELRPDRYLIRNAWITLETESPRAALETIQDAVQSRGGYVSSLNESQNPYGLSHVRLSVRVPESELDATLAGLDALGKVLDKRISTDDVTEEYVDLDARLRNLKRAEERVLEHLERTGDLEDIIKVEQELTRIRQQIEQMEGRLRFLDHRVRYSTVEITIQEKPKAQPVVPAATFSTGQVFSEAVRSLVEWFQGAWSIAIWAGVWAIVWLPVALIVLLGVRLARRRLATR